MKSEIGFDSVNRGDIFQVNSGYDVLEGIKKKLEAQNFDGAAANLDQIKAVKKFVVDNLPNLGPEQRSTPYGFYSPAHMMFNAITFVEQVFSQRNSADAMKAITAIDQAMRLMAYGMYEKNKSVRDISGRVEYKDFRLPNLVEIPDSWKNTPDGENFLVRLTEFLERRQGNKPVEQIDFNLLNSLSGLISNSYEGIKVDKNKAEQSPYARELILINLAMLSAKAEKYKGKQIPGDLENVNMIQLIRGLYNYKEAAEMEQRLRSGVTYVGLPKIIEQPEKLQK